MGNLEGSHDIKPFSLCRQCNLHVIPVDSFQWARVVTSVTEVRVSCAPQTAHCGVRRCDGPLTHHDCHTRGRHTLSSQLCPGTGPKAREMRRPRLKRSQQSHKYTEHRAAIASKNFKSSSRQTYFSFMFS